MRAGEVCVPGESQWEAKAWKTKGVIQHAVTSQNGCLKTWSESRIALVGEDWYDVRYGRLIITPDGTSKEEGANGNRAGFVLHPGSHFPYLLTNR